MLNPADPANFTKEGGQSFTVGPVLTLTDTSSGDFVAFFATDSDALPGNEIESCWIRSFFPGGWRMKGLENVAEGFGGPDQSRLLPDA